MDFLKIVRKKSFISELLYTVLNIALAVGVLLVVRYTEAVWFAILLVAISKWRVFAVRPRFWWANVRSNMVDFIVSVSFVIHMYTVNAAAINETYKLLILVGLALIYIGWLLFVKPRSRRVYVVAQAGLATFLGVSALFIVSHGWPVSLVTATVWLIGYSSARHILSSYDNETHSLFLSLVWGLVMAEIAWVLYHLSFAYPLPIFPSLMLPQAGVILSLLSFLVYKIYDSFYHHSKVRAADVILPLLFTVSAIIVLVFISLTRFTSTFV